MSSNKGVDHSKAKLSVSLSWDVDASTLPWLTDVLSSEIYWIKGIFPVSINPSAFILPEAERFPSNSKFAVAPNFAIVFSQYAPIQI